MGNETLNPIETALREANLWDALPAQVRDEISTGEVESWGDVQGDLRRPPEGADPATFREASLVLRLLLAGQRRSTDTGTEETKGVTSRDFPTPTSLKEAVVEKIRAILEGDRDQCNSYLQDLGVVEQLGPIAMATVYFVLLTDPDEGLDLIRAFKEIRLPQKKNERSLALQGLFHAALKAPRIAAVLLGSIPRYLEISSGSIPFGSRMGTFFAAADGLACFSPEMARNMVENISSTSFSEGSSREFFNIMARLGRRELATRTVIPDILEPLLTDSLGCKWGGKKPGDKKRLVDKTLFYLSRIPSLFEEPDNAARLAVLLRKLEGNPTRVNLYNKLSGLYSTGGLSRSEAIDDAIVLIDQNSDHGLQQALKTADEWGLVLPRPVVVRLISNPLFLNNIAKISKEKTFFSRLLIQIASAPQTFRIFAAFSDEIGKKEFSSDLNSLDLGIFLNDFVTLADFELIGEIDYREKKPVWRNWLTNGAAPEILDRFEATMDRLTAAALDHPPTMLASNPSSIDSIRESLPWRLVRPHEGKSTNPDNLAILQQHRDLVYLAHAGVPSDQWRDLAGEFIANLGHLQIRRNEDRPFTRIDLALNAITLLGATGERSPDILSAFLKDCEEMEGETALQRGEFFGLLISQRAHHKCLSQESLEKIIEAILTAACKPPPRHKIWDNDKTAEMIVVDTLKEFFRGDTIKHLETLPLSPRGKELFAQAREIVDRYEAGGLGPEVRGLVAAVERVFFGISETQADEMDRETLLAARLEMEPGQTPTLPSGVEETGDGTGGDETRAMTIQLVEGGSLVPFRPVMNPRTGLVEIRLGRGIRIPLLHAVAPRWGGDADEARSDWQQRSRGILTQTHRELQTLDEEQRATDALALVPPSPTNALVLQQRRDQAARLDSVTMALAASGVENPEEKLMDEIARRTDFKTGLQMIEAALRHELNQEEITLTTMADLNRYLPNMTTYEVALISLLDKVPRIALDSRAITMVYLMTVTGVEWATDDYSTSKRRDRIRAVDPYRYIGVTGAEFDTSFCHYCRPIRRLVQAALKTQLRDRHIFSFLWQRFPEAATAGLKALKSEGNPRHLLNKKLTDIDHHYSSFRPSEIAKLIGLLERVPPCLVTAEPAQLYFKPFGGAVIFFNGEMAPIDIVPYHEHLLAEAMQHIHYATEVDLTDDNPVAHQLLNDKLMGRISNAVLEQTEGKSSLLEDALIGFSSRFRIHLPLAMRIVDDELMADWEYSLEPTRSLKMGLDEVKAVTEAFSLLPNFLLDRIREGTGHGGGLTTIRKGFGNNADLMDVVTTFDRLGEYRPWEKAIVLWLPNAKPYRAFEPFEQQIFSDTIIHELGEAVFSSLSLEERESFISIYPWKSGMAAFDTGAIIPAATIVQTDPISRGDTGLTPAFSNTDLPQHLLTSYSGSNPRDLFCEAFMAYITHGPEFREKAAKSTHLREAYDWLKGNLFTTPEGTIEYQAPAKAPLAEIEGIIKRWRQEAEKRRADLERELDHEHALDEEIPDYVTSTEEMAELEEAEAAGFDRGTGYYDGTRSVDDYFGMAALDEEGREARDATNQLLRLQEIVGTEDATLVHAIVTTLKTDIFGEMLSAEEDTVDRLRRASRTLKRDGPTPELRINEMIEDLAVEVWKQMKTGNRRKVMTLLEHAIEALQGIRGEDEVDGWGDDRTGDRDYEEEAVDRAMDDPWAEERHNRRLDSSRYRSTFGGTEIEVEPDDIFDAIMEAVKRKLSEKGKVFSEIMDALCLFLLPGQFTQNDLEKIRELAIGANRTDTAVIAALNNYLKRRRGWDLEPVARVETLAWLASELTTLGHQIGKRQINILFLELESGKSDLYALADKTGLKPGAIDAFAEKFLKREEYQALIGRSEREGLTRGLKLSLAIHSDLAHKCGKLGTSIPPELFEWIPRIEAALSALRENREGAIAVAMGLLGDREHSQAIQELAGLLLRTEQEEKKGPGSAPAAAPPVVDVSPISSDPPAPVIEIQPPDRGNGEPQDPKAFDNGHFVYAGGPAAVDVYPPLSSLPRPTLAEQGSSTRDSRAKSLPFKSACSPILDPGYRELPAAGMTTQFVEFLAHKGLTTTARFVERLTPEQLRLLITQDEKVCARLLKRAGRSDLAKVITSGILSLTRLEKAQLILAAAAKATGDISRLTSNKNQGAVGNFASPHHLPLNSGLGNTALRPTLSFVP